MMPFNISVAIFREPLDLRDPLDLRVRRVREDPLASLVPPAPLETVEPE